MNSILLNKLWVTEEVQNFLKTNENGNSIHQNLWNAAKAVLREKFVAMSVYVKNMKKTMGKKWKKIVHSLENKINKCLDKKTRQKIQK